MNRSWRMCLRAASRVSLVAFGLTLAVGISVGGGTIETVVGGYAPVDGIPALETPLAPESVVVDASGNVFVSSTRWIFRIEPDNAIHVVAGSGAPGWTGDGGPATEAGMSPTSLAFDDDGNLYFADPLNAVVRKVDPAGRITTVAGSGVDGYSGDGGPATAAQLRRPAGLALDPADNLYIADEWNHVVRKVDTSGVIFTVAGTGVQGFAGDGGPATLAQLYRPTDVYVDGDGALLIADRSNARVRRVDGNGTIESLTGYFPGVQPHEQFARPYALDGADDGSLLIASLNQVLRRDGDGLLTVLAGTGQIGFGGDGGPATSALLTVNDLALAADGSLYVSDPWNKRIRRVADGLIATIAGTGEFFGEGGPAVDARLSVPWGLAVDAAGNLFLADVNEHSLRKVDPSGVITTVAGTGFAGFGGDGGPAVEARMELPVGVAVDAAGNRYVADLANSRIRRIDTAGIITTFAGTGNYGHSGDGGPATEADLGFPTGVAMDDQGNLYFADIRDDVVRKIDPSGTIHTVVGNGTYGYAGDGGPATSASLAEPWGVAVDASGRLYIGDSSNNRIRFVTSDGTIHTLAGTGTPGYNGDGIPATDAHLNFPTGIMVDDAGVVIFGDENNHRVRRIENGMITTLAGTGDLDFRGDGGPAIEAAFAFPGYVVADSSGAVLIADAFNNRVRRVVATRSPVAVCVDVVVEADAGCLGAADVDSGSFDPDGGPVTIEQMPPGPYGPGTTSVSLTVTDETGASDSCEATVIVVDVTPPELTVVLEPDLLWPPNHRMLEIGATVTVVDNCDFPEALLESVASSESDDAPGNGDGHTLDDVLGDERGTPDRAFSLRAERAGSGNGRTYTATYRATDASGNTATAAGVSIVPHDQGGISDPLTLTLAQENGGTTVSWSEVPGAMSYDVIRGRLGSIEVAGAVIDLGAVTCLEADLPETSTSLVADAELLLPGQGFFYLVEYDDGESSSVGTESAGFPRVPGSGDCGGRSLLTLSLESGNGQ